MPVCFSCRAGAAQGGPRRVGHDRPQNRTAHCASTLRIGFLPSAADLREPGRAERPEPHPPTAQDRGSRRRHDGRQSRPRDGTELAVRTVGRSAPRPMQAAHSAVSRSAARGVRGDRRSRGEQGVLGVAARSSVRDAARDDAHHAQRHLACHVRSRRRRVGAAAGNTARRNQTRIDAVVGSGAPMGLGPVESMGSVLPQSAGIRRIGGTAARHHPRGSAAPGRSSTSPSGRSRRRHWRSARGRCCRGRRSSPASACCTRTRRSFPTPIASTPTDSSPGRLTPPSGSRTAVAFVAASAPRLRPWR